MSKSTDLVSTFLRADVPILLWGAPGTGKTSAVEAMAEERGVHLEVLIGSTIDPTDLGRPIVSKDDNVVLAPPSWARRIRNKLDEGKECWLFLDELLSVPPSVQAAFLRVTQERQVAEVSIKGCKILAATNPPGQAVDVYELSHASANRWAHIDWEVDAEDWCSSELGGWGHPSKDLEDIRAKVAGWIQQQPTALLNPPPDNSEDIKGWPSPRSWSNLITALGKQGLDASHSRTISDALIGAPATTEFFTWMENMDLPSPLDLLSGREELPERGDRAMMCMTAATSYALNHGKFTDLWKLCMKQREDLSIISARRAVTALKKINIQPEMTKDLETLIARIRSFNG